MSYERLPEFLSHLLKTAVHQLERSVLRHRRRPVKNIDHQTRMNISQNPGMRGIGRLSKAAFWFYNRIGLRDGPRSRSILTVGLESWHS